MTLRVGDQLPVLEFAGPSETTWRTDEHRQRDVSLVLILHRHLN